MKRLTDQIVAGATAVYKVVVGIVFAYALVLVFLLASARCQSADLPDAPQPQTAGEHRAMFNVDLTPEPHHNWARRHAFALYISGMLAATGYILYREWPQHCASEYNGIRYNGTPPCPTDCYSLGNCDWGPHARHR